MSGCINALLSICLLLFSLTGFSQQTIHLFNGKDLTGWYSFLRQQGKNQDSLNVFTVRDGLLRISGEEWGCLTTEKNYENYRLVVEYKWGDTTYPPRLKNARDCGILIHSTGPDGGYHQTWMHGIECNIIEGGTGDFIVVGDGSDHYAITSPVGDEKHGASPVFDPRGKSVTITKGRINWWGRDPNWKDSIGFRGKQDLEKPVGAWNRLEILASGSKISTYLNGVLVNQATHVVPAKGRIQIQSESAEIFFRRIDLTPTGNPLLPVETEIY